MASKHLLSIVRLWVELGSWQETIWEQCGLVDSPVIRWVGSVGVGWKGAAASFHCAGAAGAFGAKKVFVSNAGADETRGASDPLPMFRLVIYDRDLTMCCGP